MSRLVFVTCILLVHATSASAYVQLVTLPSRDSVQLTIYNSEDITLVRENRLLTFRQGLNRLEFSWSNTLIDPTSVQLQAKTNADKIEILDVSFPPNTPDTLVWHIDSKVSGKQQVEISFFTSGLAWKADYLIEADTSQKTLDLSAHVKVTNQSGETYDDAQTRLVVGVVHLVEKIADLARRGRQFPQESKAQMRNSIQRADRLMEEEMAMPAAAKMVRSQPKQIIKEGLSEYFLYTIEGTETIPHQWSKRLRSFKAKNVPMKVFHRYEREAYGDGVKRFYKITNDKKSKLGKEPLPDGALYVYRFLDPQDHYTFVGTSNTKYIPVDEEAEFDLGFDPDVRVTPKIMVYKKTRVEFDDKGNIKGHDEERNMEILVENSKNRPV
ncbi:MAG: DUF4139 domain-containing protein, partial [Deltaproteobacteria bacterium]|nr:DUF4139 domain-containing protein [Deltaproteobacteria bacterium]